jgi:hypothetical protein
VLAGRLNSFPVGIKPTFERGQRHIERAAEVGYLIQRGRLDVLGVEAAG